MIKKKDEVKTLHLLMELSFSNFSYLKDFSDAVTPEMNEKYIVSINSFYTCIHLPYSRKFQITKIQYFYRQVAFSMKTLIPKCHSQIAYAVSTAKYTEERINRKYPSRKYINNFLGESVCTRWPHFTFAQMHSQCYYIQYKLIKL